MNNQVLLSIVIPLYNPMKFIQKCIDDLHKQTANKNEYEIIFINDGSIDEIDNFIKSNKFNFNYRYFIQENKGLGNVIVRGASLAKGRYVFSWDADDQIETDFIKKIIDKIKSTKESKVSFFVNELSFNPKRGTWAPKPKLKDTFLDLHNPKKLDFVNLYMRIVAEKNVFPKEHSEMYRAPFADLLITFGIVNSSNYLTKVNADYYYIWSDINDSNRILRKMKENPKQWWTKQFDQLTGSTNLIRSSGINNPYAEAIYFEILILLIGASMSPAKKKMRQIDKKEIMRIMKKNIFLKNKNTIRRISTLILPKFIIFWLYKLKWVFNLKKLM